MKHNYMTIALLGGFALLAASCMKEATINEQYRPAGSEIVFGAATSYDNGEATRVEYDAIEGPATRTDYSGALFGSSPKVERIDWIAEDKITVFYKQGTAAATTGDYQVAAITTNNEKSYAEVNNIGGTKLTWGDGTGDHYFYAMYPSSQMNSNASLTNTNHVKGTIPATQNITTSTKTITVDGVTKYQPNMNNAYMVSYKKIAASSTATRAELPFTPAVTTFEFKFKLNQNDRETSRTVTKFTMESASTNLRGTFEFDITGGTDARTTWGTVTQSSAGKKITVNFPDGGLQMTKNAWLDFSVLALPIEQKDITITFFFKEADGTEYSKHVLIKKNGSAATFAAAKKHIITNDELTGEVITYTLTVSGDKTFEFSGGTQNYKVTSYKQVGSNGAKYPVEWEAYRYRVGTGTDLNNITWGSWSTDKPVSLPTFFAGPRLPDNASAASFTAKIAPTDRTGTATSALTNASNRGSSESPYDLSTHKVTGGNQSKTTANCYVISHPGWYKFPLAYGNAYKGGNVNTKAYDPTAENGYTLKVFRKHDNSDIDSPDIAGVSSVELLWQDAQDLITVSDLRLEGGYVVFHIEKENICQGNAVLAVKNSSGKILWSWHIWVTPIGLNSSEYPTNATLRGQQFMSRNLGWCDAGTDTWPARIIQIQFRQTDPNSDAGTKTLTFKQKPNEITTVGSGPHYQWGRKDPLIPPIGDPKQKYDQTYANNKVWYNAAGVASQDVPISDGRPKTIGYGIQHPMHMIWLDRANLPGYSTGTNPKEYGNYDGRGWPFSDWIGSDDKYYGSGHFSNLWNYNITNGHNVDVMLTVKNFASYGHGKTIYDPCPVGYTVPLPTELSKLAITTEQMGGNDYTGSGTITWSATEYGWKTNGNLIPANGMRFYLMNNPHVGNVGTYGYYFSSAYCNAHNGLSLILNSSDLHMTASFAKGSGRSIRCVPE